MSSFLLPFSLRLSSQGYHTLLAVFAVRCLPHHTFLQYIDHGVLQLTETFVSRLMTGIHTHPQMHTAKSKAREKNNKTIIHGDVWNRFSAGGNVSRLVQLISKLFMDYY